MVYLDVVNGQRATNTGETTQKSNYMENLIFTLSSDREGPKGT